MEHRRAADWTASPRGVVDAADLAYTTIMTVLRRLADKDLVVQHRDERAHRYEPLHGRDELVAGLMVDGLDHAADSASRQAALAHFVERVSADDASALSRALAELEARARGVLGAAPAAAAGSGPGPWP